MAKVFDNESKNNSEEQKEVRNLVLDGLEQIKQGKTKDFDEVFDRLEKRYSSEV